MTILKPYEEIQWKKRKSCEKIRIKKYRYNLIAIIQITHMEKS